MTSHPGTGYAPRRPIRPRDLIKRYFRNRDGATAVEFAIVAGPFFALVLAIVETALVFFAGQMMESSVSEAGRVIRTGQAKPPAGITQTELKQQICEHAVLLRSCEAKLMLDVRVFNDFEESQDELEKPLLDDDDELDVEVQYDPGQGTDIVVVRAFYPWPSLIPGFGIGPGNLANGDRLLVAVAAFRNEPF